MNLQKINELIAQYKGVIADPAYDGWRLWELCHQFQSNWDLDADDFGAMYRSSFSINSPLWHRDNYYPKKSIERYTEISEDLVRAMFKDLLNDGKDLGGRIDRFSYQCDELYKIERQRQQKVAPHYHDDQKMIFIYLCFTYPDRYSMYDYEGFKTFMEKVGSTIKVQRQDLERYTKVSRTVGMLMQKDEELVEVIRNRTVDITGGRDYHLLSVFELYACT